MNTFRDGSLGFGTHKVLGVSSAKVWFLIPPVGGTLRYGSLWSGKGA